RNVEYVSKKSAKPTRSPPARAKITSAAGRSPKSVLRRPSSVATTCSLRRSYSARARMKARISGTSAAVARSIVMTALRKGGGGAGAERLQELVQMGIVGRELDAD